MCKEDAAKTSPANDSSLKDNSLIPDPAILNDPRYMTWHDRIQHYCDRNNLTEQDNEFFSGLLTDVILTCARSAPALSSDIQEIRKWMAVAGRPSSRHSDALRAHVKTLLSIIDNPQPSSAVKCGDSVDRVESSCSYQTESESTSVSSSEIAVIRKVLAGVEFIPQSSDAAYIRFDDSNEIYTQGVDAEYDAYQGLRDLLAAYDVLKDENQKLQRGEFICGVCGIRKDSQCDKGDF